MRSGEILGLEWERVDFKQDRILLWTLLLSWRVWGVDDAGVCLYHTPSYGRLAQRESTAFTRQGSLVRTQHRPPSCQTLIPSSIPRFYEKIRCAEAVFYFRQCGVKRLDGDGDQIPCEQLCRGVMYAGSVSSLGDP